MNLDELKKKIREKSAKIGVIGLGYVGLPVACKFAEVGFAVTGVDIVESRVQLINDGRSPIEGDEPGLAELLAQVVAAKTLHATTDYRQLADADVVLINVETPVDGQNIPRYHALRAACRSLAEVMKPGVLVIVESTIAPGTVDKVVGPILAESSGKTLNQDFYVGACPERVMPGKLLANIRLMSRVCGGSTAATAETMVALYRHIVAADLDVANVVTAELVKTAENAYRDVQIAFANEVALICEAAGADVWEVRELVNKTPFRSMHMPGAGVGGHCIPKDPWLLAHGANSQSPIRLIPAARAVNESMPLHMAALLQRALTQRGVELSAAKVAVLGYAYLENSDDTRHSPSEVLVPHLRSLGTEVVVHDPWVEGFKRDIFEVLKGCDAAVFMVRHQAYVELSLDELREALKRPILVDGRRVFEREAVVAAGFDYWGVGQVAKSLG